MKALKLVNFILAIIAMMLGFSQLFVNNVRILSVLFIPFLFIFFLLMGVEQVMAKQKKRGYLYIVAAIFFIFPVIKVLTGYL